ncbi:cysteine-rich PDZ-binding protein [Leptonychotes weddellii]|uniref:Cysteine-rich PDZ-binding protein n=1 Tax=Leptonychotes weddellii TaxID=9713 RepID=A0A7F8RF53_LEPWE|nr:cysteine-rich PDZ-binding protein [Leptonychotes weddellii]
MTPVYGGGHLSVSILLYIFFLFLKKKKTSRFDPYGKNKFSTCRICKSSVHQPGSHYCQGCAYKKGICAMCGKKVLDTKNYKQTSV